MSKDAKFNLIFNFSSLYTIILLSTVFSVSRSGYYKWKNRKFNPKPNPDIKIKKLFIEMQLMSDFTTEYRKMHIYLFKNKNIDITEYQTYCIMKKYGLLSKSIHSKKNSIINNYLVKYNNLIKGDFSANIPNTKWCIDIPKIDSATPNDNAVIESFFASLKKEFVYRKIYKTKKEAIKDVEFYIFFYNNYRIQLKTGITPMQLRKTAIAA